MFTSSNFAESVRKQMFTNRNVTETVRKQLSRFIETAKHDKKAITFHAHIPCCVGYGSSMQPQELNAIVTMLVMHGIPFTFYLSLRKENNLNGSNRDEWEWRTKLNSYVRNNPRSALALFVKRHHIKNLDSWRKGERWKKAELEYNERRREGKNSFVKVLGVTIESFKNNHKEFKSELPEEQAILDRRVEEHVIEDTIDFFSWFNSEPDPSDNNSTVLNILLSPDPPIGTMDQIFNCTAAKNRSFPPIEYIKLKFNMCLLTADEISILDEKIQGVLQTLPAPRPYGPAPKQPLIPNTPGTLFTLPANFLYDFMYSRLSEYIKKHLISLEKLVELQNQAPWIIEALKSVNIWNGFIAQQFDLNQLTSLPVEELIWIAYPTYSLDDMMRRIMFGGKAINHGWIYTSLSPKGFLKDSEIESVLVDYMRKRICKADAQQPINPFLAPRKNWLFLQFKSNTLVSSVNAAVTSPPGNSSPGTASLRNTLGDSAPRSSI